MKRLLKNEKGSILVLSVFSLTALLVFASLAIDVGCLLTARNQLQSAADASALAGATGLFVDQSVASVRAVNVGNQNNCVNQPIQMGAGDVSFPTADQVRVQLDQDVNTFFAKVVGIESFHITAVAVAELETLTGVRGLRPFALPDMGWPTGTPVIVKAGNLGAPATSPGFFYPVDFPGLNRGSPETGAAIYELNIAEGTNHYVQIGDILQVEPGNMVGPTKSGVLDLINLDPNAYWDGSQVVNSDYPGASSPRIVTIPLYDYNDPPSSGRNTIEVIGLAAFFIDRLQGKDVIGYFMGKVTTGNFGPGYSFLFGTRLIQ